MRRPETEQWLDETARADYLPRLRAALKAQKITQGEFAAQCGCSASWMGVVLRGHYPFHGAGQVPKYIWERARCMMR